MRGCWIDHGAYADINKLKRNGITEVIVPAVNSPLYNADQLIYLKNQGFDVGIMVAWNWYPGLTGAQFAQKCSDLLKNLGPTSPNPKLQVDIEKGGHVGAWNYVDFVVSFMKRWRQLRPTRETDFTLEAMQGGLFNGRGDAVQVIIDANVTILPQFYTGDMRPIAADVALKDLLLYNFPAERIKGYYDAANLPLNWDGCAWTQGRLP